jgi:MraZ protein
MFIGEYQYSLDEKGRLAVPSKFRVSLGEGAVITRGLDNCLFIFTKDEWKKLADKLAAMPISQANSRAFARLMLAGAMDVEPDSQGRVMVPEYLRQYAQLKKKVVIAGLYNRLEIWDEAQWAAFKSNTEKDSTHIAEQIAELGI